MQYNSKIMGLLTEVRVQLRSGPKGIFFQLSSQAFSKQIHITLIRSCVYDFPTNEFTFLSEDVCLAPDVPKPTHFGMCHKEGTI